MKLFCIAVLLNGCIVASQQYSHLTIQQYKNLSNNLAVPARNAARHIVNLRKTHAR